MKRAIIVSAVAILVGGPMVQASSGTSPRMNEKIQSDKPIDFVCYGENDTKLFEGRFKSMFSSHIGVETSRTYHQGTLITGETVEITCRNVKISYE